MTTRLGHQVKTPSRLTFRQLGEVAATSIGLTAAEENYYKTVELFQEAFAHEFCFVVAGVGGSFVDTHELHTIKFNEVMTTSDAPQWEEAADKEHNQMIKSQMFQATPMKR
jgi:hypothetical protein